MVEMENQHYLSKHMEIIDDGLKVDLLSENAKHVRKMKMACECVITYYEMNRLTQDRDGEKQIAEKLLSDIQRECPEHLI